MKQAALGTWAKLIAERIRVRPYAEEDDWCLLQRKRCPGYTWRCRGGIIDPSKRAAQIMLVSSSERSHIENVGNKADTRQTNGAQPHNEIFR